MLHFHDNPGARHRDDLRTMLRDGLLPGYDKAITPAHFERRLPGIGQTIARPQRLAADAADLDDDPHKNPTTSAYRLIQSIARTDATPGGTTP